MARGGTEEEKAAAWPPWLTVRAEEEEAADAASMACGDAEEEQVVERPPWPAA